MGETFTGNQPIYLQLIGRISRLIVRGEWKPGEKLPSVRELAVHYGVNPNTMQRVNMELERMKVVETRRGQGTFVTEDRVRIKDLREEWKQEYVDTFVKDMEEMGFQPAEIEEGVRFRLHECMRTQEGSRQE